MAASALADAAPEPGGRLRLRPRGHLESVDRGSTAQAIADGDPDPNPGAEVAIVSWPSDDLRRLDRRPREPTRCTIMNTWGVGRGRRQRRPGRALRHGPRQHGARPDLPVRGHGLHRPVPRARRGRRHRQQRHAAEGQGRRPRRRAPGRARRRSTTSPSRAAIRIGRSRTPSNAGLVVLLLGGAALVLALFLRTWWERGRDARGALIDDSVLLPAPPPGLTPALATVLRTTASTARASPRRSSTSGIAGSYVPGGRRRTGSASTSTWWSRRSR